MLSQGFFFQSTDFSSEFSLFASKGTGLVFSPPGYKIGFTSKRSFMMIHGQLVNVMYVSWFICSYQDQHTVQNPHYQNGMHFYSILECIFQDIKIGLLHKF